MKRFLTLTAVFGALSFAAMAAPQKITKPVTKATAKSALPKCPQCKMQMTVKADKTHTAVVKVNGKTYYCCAACGMHKTAKTPDKANKRPAVAPDCPKCQMKMAFTSSLLKKTPFKVNGTTYYCCTICPRH